MDFVLGSLVKFWKYFVQFLLVSCHRDRLFLVILKRLRNLIVVLNNDSNLGLFQRKSRLLLSDLGRWILCYAIQLAQRERRDVGLLIVRNLLQYEVVYQIFTFVGFLDFLHYLGQIVAVKDLNIIKTVHSAGFLVHIDQRTIDIIGFLVGQRHELLSEAYKLVRKVQLFVLAQNHRLDHVETQDVATFGELLSHQTFVQHQNVVHFIVFFVSYYVTFVKKLFLVQILGKRIVYGVLILVRLIELVSLGRLVWIVWISWSKLLLLQHRVRIFLAYHRFFAWSHRI